MVSEVWASENVIADYYASGTPSMFNFDAGTAKGALVNAVRKGDPVSLVNSMLKYQNDFSPKIRIILMHRFVQSRYGKDCQYAGE